MVTNQGRDHISSNYNYNYRVSMSGVIIIKWMLTKNDVKNWAQKCKNQMPEAVIFNQKINSNQT